MKGEGETAREHVRGAGGAGLQGEGRRLRRRQKLALGGTTDEEGGTRLRVDVGSAQKVHGEQEQVHPRSSFTALAGRTAVYRALTPFPDGPGCGPAEYSE